MKNVDATRPSSKMKLLPLLFLLLLIPSLALAQRGHLTLLTVAEDSLNGTPQGGTADLYLEIKSGSGQIFIDTFPLTRLDTQSSTRYANQIACAYLDRDCSNYDFFYTIRADSSVVGGPSAGAAIATLTVMLLEGSQPDESVAMTGTINSGGIIGPVAGIESKAQAAKDKGIELLLISTFSYPTRTNQTYLNSLNSSRNISLNLSNLNTPINLSTLPIPIKQVSTLKEAVAYFSGNQPEPKTIPKITENPDYTQIMRDIADRLCSRHSGLESSLLQSGILNESDQNLTQRINEARENGDWYSVASYCFGSLINLRTQSFEELSQRERQIQYASLRSQINAFQYNLQRRNITTIADLETSMIVSERLKESAETLQNINNTNISARSLAFAYERYNSANVWSSFFALKSEQIKLNSDHLKQACQEKLSEAEERIGYVELYLPDSYAEAARNELRFAHLEANEANYANCIFSAAKAQAQADLISTTLAVPTQKVEELLQDKLSTVALVIEDQQKKGYFPIVGYSYYRYATSLQEHDPYSALTFSEYALELSNLDRFFPRKNGFVINREAIYLAVLFISGLFCGFVAGVLFTARKLTTKPTKHKSAFAKKKKSNKTTKTTRKKSKSKKKK